MAGVTVNCVSSANVVSMEKFIAEVEKNRELWDPTCEGYVRKSSKDAAWNRVLYNLFDDVEDKPDYEKTELIDALQKKFRNARTCFARELRARKKEEEGLRDANAKPRKPYLYFSNLQFLEPFTKTLSLHSFADKEEEELVVEDGLVLEALVFHPEKCATTTATTTTTVQKKRRVKDESEEEESCRVETGRKQRVVSEYQTSGSDRPSARPSSPSEEEDDRLFLLSLVSEMKRVPREKKIKVKTDILMVISNYQKF